MNLSAHEILGVSPQATLEEIKEAYRRLSAKAHPDRNDGDKASESYFKLINDAYETCCKNCNQASKQGSPKWESPPRAKKKPTYATNAKRPTAVKKKHPWSSVLVVILIAGAIAVTRSFNQHISLPTTLVQTNDIPAAHKHENSMETLSDKQRVGIVNKYRKAAENGNAVAQYNLGVAYARGDGVSQNYTEAAKWYRKAAEQGEANAQTYLGLAYINGEGVTPSYKEFLKWTRKGAIQGNVGAQCNLGFAYAEGKGANKNPEEAVKWFRKAAEQGDIGAQINLGLAYAKGLGITQNYSKAYFWAVLGATNGNPENVKIRNMIAKELDSSARAQIEEEASLWKP